jgi:hypothetical protein
MALGMQKLSAVPVSFVAECGLGGMVAAGVYALSYTLRQPVVAPAPPRVEPHAPPTLPRPQPSHSPVTAPVVHPQSCDEEPGDIIMLDLD